MSIPSLSISAMRSAPSARPPAWRSNGVPFTTSATPSTVQCEWTSMTVTRLPPIEICLRGPAGTAAPPPPRPPPPPRCASAGSWRPATYAPAAAPAMVLKKSLLFCIFVTFVFLRTLRGLRRRRRREFQQLHQVAAENRFLLRVVQQPVVQDRIRIDRPGERHVRPVHDLSDPHLRNHVAEPIVSEDHRVGHDLGLEVFVHRTLLRAACVGLADARAVCAPHV